MRVRRVSGLLLAFCLATLGALSARAAELTGIWVMDEGFQVTELLFRSDGRYHRETRSSDPNADFTFSDRGRYSTDGATLTLSSYEYIGQPEGKVYRYDRSGETLTLERPEFSIVEVYELRPGSRETVLAREAVASALIGTWERNITFFGREERTFRPGGYSIAKSIPLGEQFPPEFIRGRYEENGATLKTRPYSGTEAVYEADIFGDELTLIRAEEFSGDGTTYKKIAGSEESVRAKAAEAAAFLGRANWQVGLWEIRDAVHTVDLTLRPDGGYIAKEDTQFLEGIVRGRYVLANGSLQFEPFSGQGIYARSNGDFGKAARSWTISISTTASCN